MSGRVVFASLSLFSSLAFAQGFAIPEPQPAAVARHDVELSADDQRRYLDEWRHPPDPTVGGGLRVAMGGMAWFADERSIGGSFGIDLESIARATYPSGFTFQISAGYGASAGDVSAHLALLGGGIGFATRQVSIVYMARLGAGAISERAAIGVRHGLLLAFWNVVGLRAEHALFDVERDTLAYQGVVVLLTFDLGGLLEVLG